MNNPLKPVKTAFFGLDNGGKTSIIQALENRLILGKPIKPTTNYEISSQKISLLGLEIFTWDFGGQEMYRDVFLNRKKQMLSEEDLLVYVIDIQDFRRFDESIKYLIAIQDSLRAIGKKLRLFVLFHKYDPLFGDNDVFDGRIEDLKQKISKMDNWTDMSFYRTSIYEMMTIVRAFADMSSHFSNKPQQIQKLLNKYVENTLSTTAILFSKRNFILDTKGSDDTSVKALEKVAQIYSDSIDELENYNLETLEIVTTVKKLVSKQEEDRAMIFVQKLAFDSVLYLVTLTTNQETKFKAFDQMELLTRRMAQILNPEPEEKK